MRSFRSFLTRAALLTLLAVAPAAAQAPQLYLIVGLQDYSPYGEHILELVWKGKYVSGRLRPLLGDTTPPIAVTGSNYQDGKLQLTIATAPSQTLYLTRSVKDGKVVWASDAPDPFTAVTFSRPLRGDWSDAALTLTVHECGSHYGLIAFEFANVTMRDVEQKLPRELLDFEVGFYDLDQDKELRIPFREVARRKLNRKQTDSETPPIDVAVGSELYIVKKLRESGLVKSANLGRPGCSGGDRSYFIVKRDLFFADSGFLQEKFVSFVDLALPQILGTDGANKKWEMKAAEPVVKKVMVPPYTTAYRLKVYASSEVTRKVSGFWDRFHLTLEPYESVDQARDEISVVLTVERLRSAKQTTARIPSDDWFTKELDFNDEAAVTTALARGFAARGAGRCLVELEGVMLCERGAGTSR